MDKMHHLLLPFSQKQITRIIVIYYRTSSLKSISMISEQSVIYSLRHNRPNPSLSLTEYNYHANFRNLWSRDEDIRNHLVSDTISRNHQSFRRQL